MRTHKPTQIPGPSANVQALGPNPNRTAVILSHSTAAAAGVSFGGDSTNNPDFIVVLSTSPVIITRDLLGDLIQSPINVTLAGATTLTITEVTGS